jgi:hypothetical protein
MRLNPARAKRPDIPARRQDVRRIACFTLALTLTMVFRAEAGSGDRSPPPTDPPVGSAAPSPGRNAALDMAALNASGFAAAAQRDGIEVSAEQVNQRVDMYKSLYPGQEVGPDKVRTLLLAEKYLEANGMWPRGAAPEKGSEGKADSARFASPEQAELAKKAERLHSLLDREDTQRKAAALDDLSRIQSVSEVEPRTMRPQSDLQLRGDPEECLAWAGRNCLIPLREYNAATAYYPMPDGMPLDSAKAIILKRYLSEKRMALEALDKGLDRQADSLVARVKSKKEDFRWMQAALPFGMPVSDLRLLEAAYSRYYARYFARGQDVTLAIIASSDSTYIDSLHRVYRSWERKRAMELKAGRPAPKEPLLPWSYFKKPQVSKELAALADTLKAGQCGPPTRFPQGRFLVRLAKAVPTREISFHEANQRLIYLATRDKFLDMDSVVQALAKKYYAANIAQYTSPDTLSLRAWLIPHPEPSPAAPRGRTVKTAIVADTARFKSMEMSSLALPTGLRMALQERVKRDSTRSFFGPLADGFGRWYFQVGSRKPGHGVLPFRLARKDILERMTALPDEQGSGTASDEAQEEIGEYLALAQALRQERFRKEAAERDGKRPPEDGAPASHANDLSEAEQAKAIEAASARIRAEEAERRADEARMLKEARVDLSRLFR